MVEVRIGRDRDGKIIRFSGSGHSGYAKKGEDVVCAAVSALLQTAVVGLEDYIGLEVFSTRGKDGLLEASLGEVNGQRRQLADAILETMVIGLRCIERDYTGYVRVIDNSLQPIANS